MKAQHIHNAKPAITHSAFALTLALLAGAPLVPHYAFAGDQVAFRYTPLDVPGALVNPALIEGTECVGINDRGVVVGYYSTPPNGDPAGFVYQDGSLTTLVIPGAGGDPNPPSLGVNFLAEVMHINNHDLAVGDYGDANGFVHGFLRQPGGQITYLPNIPGALESGQVFASINDSGTIVGGYSTVPMSDPTFYANYHGFILEHGRYTQVVHPGAEGTYLTCINDRGDITGIWFDGANNSHGFLLRHGVFTTIDYPGAANTLIYNLNDRGQIVGNYLDANFGFHGFFLQDGVFTLLHYPGSTDTQVVGLNNRGQIVGSYNNWSRGYIARISESEGDDDHP